MAVPRGVEPPTFGLGNRCSIFFAVQPRSDPGLTFYFQDTFRFFMTCISDGSLETGQHGGGGLSIYPGGVRPYFKRSKFFWHRCPVLPSCFHRLSLWKQKILLKEIRESLQMVAGAPEEIRTPDPQIRSQRVQTNLGRLCQSGVQNYSTTGVRPADLEVLDCSR